MKWVLPFLAVANASLSGYELAFQQAANEIAYSPDVKKFNKIIQMVYQKLIDAPNFLENFPFADRWGQKKVFIEMLQEYGCHCFPTNKSTYGGKGAPVDQLDEACRNLFRCHKCVRLEDTTGSCDPDTVSYRFETDITQDPRANICRLSNRDSECMMNTCQCDNHFAATVYNLWTNADGSNWTYNFENWYNGRYLKYAKANNLIGFDHAGTCRPGMLTNLPDACCGTEYPHKQPYASGIRQCCAADGQTYNALLDKCCDDGVRYGVSSCF